jgi:YD repeat-containing protein
VQQIAFKQGTVTRMTTTKQYDFLNRLTSITTRNAQLQTLNSHAYTYNDANQRTRATLADGSFWIYEYDKLGQVRSGKKYWSDWTPVAGQQFEYGFDDIGNRTQTKAGGDASGAGLRPASYTANMLIPRGAAGAANRGLCSIGGSRAVAGAKPPRERADWESGIAFDLNQWPVIISRTRVSYGQTCCPERRHDRTHARVEGGSNHRRPGGGQCLSHPGTVRFQSPLRGASTGR